MYTLSEEEQKKIKGLPKSLGEALDALEADHDYLTKGGVFPQRLIDVWVARKRGELKKLEQIPNPAGLRWLTFYKDGTGADAEAGQGIPCPLPDFCVVLTVYDSCRFWIF